MLSKKKSKFYRMNNVPLSFFKLFYIYKLYF